MHCFPPSCSKILKDFRNFKGHRNIKNNLRNLFQNARNSFDKLLRKCERNYNNNVISNIEQLGKNNHKQFGNTIKQLGPKKRDIPLKVEKEGNLVSNVEDVLNVWKNDFEQFYNPQNPPAQPVDHEFVNFVNNEKKHI